MFQLSSYLYEVKISEIEAHFNGQNGKGKSYSNQEKIYAIKTLNENNANNALRLKIFEIDWSIIIKDGSLSSGESFRVKFKWNFHETFID